MTLIREKNLEGYLLRRIQARGGLCMKFTSPGNAGVPDRIAILPNNEIFFIEVKAPGRRPRALQLRVIKTLEALGCQVAWVSSKESIDALFP
jgi:hypothetical protein